MLAICLGGMMKCELVGEIKSFDYKDGKVVIEGDMEASDTYHTFTELYAHRITLFVALMKGHKEISWKSKLHNDGTSFDGWFIAGMKLPTGDITYHIPERFWNAMENIETLENAPEWDGHTSDDVVRRLNNWSMTL